MLTMDRAHSTLLVIDFQGRLMPAIHEGEVLLTNARRLIDAAALLEVPTLFTEQNAPKLGPTVEALGPVPDPVHKMTFDSTAAPGFLDRLAPGHALVVAGCEAHVCVLQTVLGLLAHRRKVFVVRDAIGSRRQESKDAAIARMSRHGAEIVTTEMAAFEWLHSCEHPRFRAVSGLIK